MKLTLVIAIPALRNMLLLWNAKGQLISKGHFGVFNSSKKKYEKIRPNSTMIPQVELFLFIFFWKNWGYQKVLFEINWLFKGLENEQGVRAFLAHSCNVGDWFVLYQLSKNTDKVFFSQLLPVIVDECKKQKQGGTKELYPSSQLEKLPHDQELINMEEIPHKNWAETVI